MEPPLIRVYLCKLNGIAHTVCICFSKNKKEVFLTSFLTFWGFGVNPPPLTLRLFFYLIK
ncbi:MAG: hypothetical protein COV69_03350 [Parcubacteria group bacterium CG11_big_fil_rev_8_21_14_0_20_39_14]|nr:MAG: hypothetical protein COV69_03350 [Parcubacteria group bacterium CG11_big_fil_rev_8_21_14_0_20_39_14]